jgi:hypothetical protein
MVSQGMRRTSRSKNLTAPCRRQGASGRIARRLRRIELDAIAAGEGDGHDTLNHSCPDSHWRFTCLAVQQRLGVLPKWRYRIGSGCIDRVAAYGADLTPTTVRISHPPSEPGTLHRPLRSSRRRHPVVLLAVGTSIGGRDIHHSPLAPAAPVVGCARCCSDGNCVRVCAELNIALGKFVNSSNQHRPSTK